MRPLTRTAILSTLVSVLALAGLPALADNSVTIDEATESGGTATVSGTFNLDPITEAQSIGGTNVDWQGARPQAQAVAGPVASAAGINMTDATIVPLADGSGLRFTWVLEDLPAQVPPEGVRYTWGIRIGTTQYQLQAKRTNLLSITTVEDPVNHIKHAASGDFFQLRGACVTSYEGTPVSGCYHLAFLTGSFDTDANTVSMDWPFNTKDAIGRLVAPDFKPGAVLFENQSANMSIAAAFQAFAGNTDTSDYTNGWNPYYTAPTIDLATGADTAAPEGLNFNTPATVTGTTFTGQVAGLSASRNSVWVRACLGATCVYASRRLL
jgi:hypothetical protein